MKWSHALKLIFILQSIAHITNSTAGPLMWKASRQNSSRNCLSQIHYNTTGTTSHNIYNISQMCVWFFNTTIPTGSSGTSSLLPTKIKQKCISGILCYDQPCAEVKQWRRASAYTHHAQLSSIYTSGWREAIIVKHNDTSVMTMILTLTPMT